MLYGIQDQLQELPEAIDTLRVEIRKVENGDRALLGGLLGDERRRMEIEDLYYDQEQILEKWFDPDGLPLRNTLEKYVDENFTSLIVTTEVATISLAEEAGARFLNCLTQLQRGFEEKYSRSTNIPAKRSLVDRNINLRHLLVVEVIERLVEKGVESHEVNKVAENLMIRSVALDWMDLHILHQMSGKNGDPRLRYNNKMSTALKAVTEQIVYGTTPDEFFDEISKFTPKNTDYQTALTLMEAGVRAEAKFVEIVENCPNLTLVGTSEKADTLEATDYIVVDEYGNGFRVNVKSSQYPIVLGCQGFRGQRRPMHFYRNGHLDNNMNPEPIPPNLLVKASEGDPCLVVFIKPRASDLEGEEILGIMRNTMHTMNEERVS